MRNRAGDGPARFAAGILGIFVLAGSTGPRAGVPGQGVELFTEREAQELRIQGNEWDPVPRARSATLGPLIVVRLPEVKRIDGGDTIETTSPTTMEVEFRENQAPVDMRSLEVVAKKGIFRKSLTDMLTPFLDGTKLTAENLEVPSGKFQIQILVRDLKGRETAQTYRLIVDDGPAQSQSR